MSKNQPSAGAVKANINTNMRLFDLVRFMRSELHEQNLITDEEHAWLCHSEMATSKQGGSPSPRRLEDYDRLQRENNQLRAGIIDVATQMNKLRQQLTEEQFARTDITRKYHDQCSDLAHGLHVTEARIAEALQCCEGNHDNPPTVCNVEKILSSTGQTT